MCEKSRTSPRPSAVMNQSAAPPLDEEDRLLAEYGDDLQDYDLSDAQKKEFLMALWHIMRGFAELGYSVKSGDKFMPDADLGMDDVLEYLIPSDTAPETSAPNNHKNKKESR